MKPHIILLSLLLSLSTNTSADWWDGWDNPNGSTPLQKNTPAIDNTTTQNNTKGNAKIIDWGRGKVDTKMTTGARGNSTGNTQGYGIAPPPMKGYIPNYGTRSNKQNNYNSPSPFPSTNPLFSRSKNTQLPFPFPHNNNRFSNNPHYRSPLPMRNNYQIPMQYNRPIYRQTPYRMRQPLPFQAPYGNRGYGYPNQASSTEQHYLQKTKIINMQHTMETQRQQYNAFIAKMEAQQKKMMSELTQQTTHDRHHQPEKE